VIQQVLNVADSAGGTESDPRSQHVGLAPWREGIEAVVDETVAMVDARLAMNRKAAA